MNIFKLAIVISSVNATCNFNLTTPFKTFYDTKGVSNTVKDGVRTISYKGTDKVKMYFGL